MIYAIIEGATRGWLFRPHPPDGTGFAVEILAGASALGGKAPTPMLDLPVLPDSAFNGRERPAISLIFSIMFGLLRS